MTPTQRTLKYYRDKGYRAWISEHWNAYAGIRQDLFGFIDIVVLTGNEILGVQTSSGANHSTRLHKILANNNAHLWLKSGGRIVIVTWRKGANGRYAMREEEITIERINAETDASSNLA